MQNQLSIDLPEYAACLWGDYRYVGLYGGRGGAKSRTIASALILQAAQRHERVLCGREIQKSIKDSSKRLLDDEIDRLGWRSSFKSTDTEIRGPNDSLFLFTGVKGNASGIKSIAGITTFWGDEAQAFSLGSIETLVPTIREPKSRLIFSWNPDLPTDPIDVLLRSENPPPNSFVKEVNYYDNPWFPAELQAEMEYDQGRDIDKYNHIWLGRYRQNSEARVFRNWRVEAFESPNNVIYRQGADFGFSIDPSCMVRCWIDGTRIYIDYEAYGLNVETVNLPHLFRSIPDCEKWWTTADSSRPETISHLRNEGFKITSSVKGARSVEEGVEWLKSYDLIIHPRCTHLIDELTLYSYKTDKLTGQVLPVLEDKDNHMIDALRYAVEGARRALKERPALINVTIPTNMTGFSRRA